MAGAAFSRKPSWGGAAVVAARRSSSARRARAAVDQAASGIRGALGPVVRWPDAVQRVGAGRAVADHRLADQPAQEPQVRGQTQHDGLVERPRQAVERIRPVVPARDDLGEHRIEPATDFVALGDAGIDPDALPGRPSKALDAPGRGQEAVLGILGVEANLDRVAVEADVGLREPQRFACGDAELVGDEVTARRELGDRVLDLEPRVHLEERERASVVQQELAGPGAHVADGARQREGGFAHRSAKLRPTAGEGASSSTFWWRRWIEQSRSPRWTPLPWLSNRTWISTCRAPSRSRSRMRRSSWKAACASRRAAASSVVRRSAKRTVRMPLPPPPAAGLTSNGIADALGRLDEGCVRLVVIVVAGGHGDAEARRELPARRLVAHGSDGFRWWPDPADPGLDHALGEVGVLGEEAEARVERVGVRVSSGGDHSFGVQEVDSVRAVRGWGNCSDAESIAGPGDPCRDLAAIRDEEGADRAVLDGDDGIARCLERANRVKRDTPTATNPPGRHRSTRDPALDRPRRRPKPPRDLARAQFVVHRGAIVAPPHPHSRASAA